MHTPVFPWDRMSKAVYIAKLLLNELMKLGRERQNNNSEKYKSLGKHRLNQWTKLRAVKQVYLI